MHRNPVPKVPTIPGPAPSAAQPSWYKSATFIAGRRGETPKKSFIDPRVFAPQSKLAPLVISLSPPTNPYTHTEIPQQQYPMSHKGRRPENLQPPSSLLCRRHAEGRSTWKEFPSTADATLAQD
ncbi:hypothetical protein BYT27DRAFT_7252243 [Phlegmacium glaucopus]|nr:hypothetical protein BYT27DRAFT_7252243 [Phlegmacium glaucopus]